MKKNNKLTGIITLAVVVVLSIAIIIGTKYLTKYDDAGNEGTTETTEGGIDISGYSNTGTILINSAQELDDGYIVTVASKGFAGEILMDVEFDKTGNTVKSLKINDHQETEGYGARITEEAFLSQFNEVPAPISLSGGAPVVSKENEAVETIATTTEATTTEAGNTPWTDGTYVAETEVFDQNGYINTVSLTIESGKITEVIWDAYNNDGEYKSVLSADGAYVMTEDGPTWQEQAIAIADFVVQNQTTNAIYYDENGKTDSVTGVSITVSDFVKLVENCLVQAATGEATAEVPAEETPVQEAPAEDTVATGAIDGVSGATISSEAVVNGINKAQSFIKEFVLSK